MCLPCHCLETDFITLFSYYCARVLLRNGCFCGSTLLAWYKYATIFSTIKGCNCYSNRAESSSVGKRIVTLPTSWNIGRCNCYPVRPNVTGGNDAIINEGGRTTAVSSVGAHLDQGLRWDTALGHLLVVLPGNVSLGVSIGMT
jgi:hypothetical protein